MEGRTASRARPSGGDGSAKLGLALEFLRVAGTFLVLAYHAALAYLASPMRLTLWHVYDPRGHVSMDVFAYWVNGFAMPLFFLAAGASAPAAVESRGLGTFLKHRAGRLLRPLLFGCLTVLPVTYLIYGYGLLVTGRITLNHIAHWRFPDEVRWHLYGLAHLWFLEYLFVVCVVWGGLWWLARRGVVGRVGSVLRRGVDRSLESAWSPVLMAIPTGLIFLLDTDTVLRVDNVIVPNPSRLAHYLYFFAAGGWLSRASVANERLARHGRLYLGLAALTFVVMTPSLLKLAAAPLVGGERVGFVVLASLFPWLAVLGGLGACQRDLSGKGPVLRFLGESSFWVYVIHLPIVVGAQVLLTSVGWPGPVKFLVTTFAAVVLSLLSFQYVARYSLVGEIVNGARRRLKNPGRFGPEFGWAATLAVVLLCGFGFVWQIRVFLWQDNLHEVVAGQLYRSGRLSTGEFQRVVREEKVRTVVTFSGTNHGWIDRQRQVARPFGATIHVVNLRDDREPSRQTLRELLEVLERSPRPILIQGYRGLDHCGFAAALARMIEGAPPAEALDQFGMRYTQFGGVDHSLLGGVLLEYRDWLAERNQAHSPGTLKSWADREYRPAEALADQGRPGIAR
ncbi:MAG: acyltransferase family protein [Isosphaeraceae bacterium]